MYSQNILRILSGFFNTWNFLQSYKNSVLAFKWHQINDIWLNFLNYWDIRLYLSSWKPPFLLNWILVDFKFQTIAWSYSNEFQIFLGSADSQDFSDFKDVPKMPKEGQIKPWNMYLKLFSTLLSFYSQHTLCILSVYSQHTLRIF